MKIDIKNSVLQGLPICEINYGEIVKFVDEAKDDSLYMVTNNDYDHEEDDCSYVVRLKDGVLCRTEDGDEVLVQRVKLVEDR